MARDTPSVQVEPIADGRIEPPDASVPLGVIREALIVIVALPVDALGVIHIADSLWLLSGRRLARAT